jgi:hypothetical protein
VDEMLGELRIDNNSKSRPFGGQGWLFQALFNAVLRW